MRIILRRRSEFVAHVWHGENKFRLGGILFELAAQAANVRIDGAGKRAGVVTPNRAQQLAAQNGSAAALQQIAKEL